MVGSTLSRFRIVASLGAGGMGEVYRAEDSTLGREVAIKVLPDAFVADPDRVARFEREARVLASLSHPSIAAIYEVGHADGKHFLVMELARGETLAARLARGRIPVAEALPMALQIAEALDAAHERGVVHRDLKPANVMADDEAGVKVLDFGLAKALAPGGEAVAAADLAHSPTLTRDATVAGVLLGTAAYMSPEQARGRPADRRADVWAFGVLLWEMLTGERLFRGESVSDVVAAVLRAEVDLAILPAETPAEIRRLLRRCLCRDPRRRLRDIGDARLEIADAIDGLGATEAAPPPGRTARWGRPAAVAGIAALAALAALAGWLAGRDPHPAAETPTRLPLAMPAGYDFAVRIHPALAMSPDGRRQVFTAYGADGTDVLLARDLAEPEPRVLAGTEGARSPFFSPDGQWVGFFTPHAMLRVPFAGGPVEPLATTSGQDRGGDWATDGSIVYAPSPECGLFRLPPGGEPAPLTTLDARQRERTHRWPSALPGSRHVLFTCDTMDSPQQYDDSRIEVVDTTTGERKVVVEGANRAAWSPSGHLLFARGGALFAVPFDRERLAVAGEPRLVLQGLRTHIATGAAQFAVSADGSLLYVPGTATVLPRQPVWATGFDTVEPTGIPAGPYFHVSLSPDASRVALTRVGDQRNDLWIADLARGTMSRLTFGGAMGPVWSPDGKRIAYQRSASASYLAQDSDQVLWKAADGSDDEQVLWRSDTPVSASSFTPDGKLLLVYRYETPTAGAAGAASAAATGAAVSRDMVAGAADLWVVPLAGGEPRLLFSAPGFQYAAEVSPDGRWLVYLSDETGRYEVYVRRFDAPGGKWQVSANGGVEPHWGRDGRSLYYRYQRELLRVPVELGEAFAAGTPERVASGQVEGTNPRTYDVAPDGRILFLQVMGWPETSAPVLVLGFAGELERGER